MLKAYNKKVTNKRASPLPLPLPCTNMSILKLHIFQLEVLIYSSALCFIIFIFYTSDYNNTKENYN